MVVVRKTEGEVIDSLETPVRRLNGSLQSRYQLVRACTEALAAPLSAEDQQVQTMPDVSPTKWHLAHVTWFFETFILKDRMRGYEPFDPTYEFLFNSYYEAVGPRHARQERGFLTRPSADHVMRYRRHVDEAMDEFLSSGGAADADGLDPLVTLGLHHEQQHQELLLMDIKHVFSCNPLFPAYNSVGWDSVADTAPMRWIEIDGGVRETGHDGNGFAFDNEGPCHEVLLRSFRFGSRLVTNGEYLEFLNDDGYKRPEFWFMDGIETVRRESWAAPGYWHEIDGEWFEFTLSGLQPLDPALPVSHVSYYEAAAYAAWAGHRLATEAEWECAAALLPANIEDGTNLLNSDRLHPSVASASSDGPGHRPRQMVGDLWEWTQSPYSNYPGFRSAAGAIGEYNGKFMTNQMVLRGGSCVTPAGHIRTTYRNFYYPHQRWMYSGIRLANDA